MKYMLLYLSNLTSKLCFSFHYLFICCLMDIIFYFLINQSQNYDFSSLICFYKIIEMPQKLSFDHQVSPWEIKLDATFHEYHKTMKKSQFKLVRNKKASKIIERKKTPRIKQNKNYFLFVINSPTQHIAHTTPIDNRKHESQSILRRLKDRLKTVSTDDSILIQNSVSHSETILQKKRPSMRKNSKKVLPKVESRTPRLIIDVKINTKKNTPKIVANHSQIFARREQLSPKVMQRMKSNKRLILPRIQLCTLQY